MSSLRIVEDTIEMDQRAVATLVPGLQLSLRDQLIAIFDAVDEDEAHIAQLEGRIAQMEEESRNASMTNLVDQYFTVLQRVGVNDFDHPELEGLRRQMSDEERSLVIARLEEEGQAALAEADALEKFGQRKFGANDNPSQ